MTINDKGMSRRDVLKGSAAAGGVLVVGSVATTGIGAAGPPSVKAWTECTQFGSPRIVVRNESNHTVDIFVDDVVRSINLRTGWTTRMSVSSGDVGNSVLVEARKSGNDPSLRGKGGIVPVNGSKEGDYLQVPNCPSP